MWNMDLSFIPITYSSSYLTKNLQWQVKWFPNREHTNAWENGHFESYYFIHSSLYNNVSFVSNPGYNRDPSFSFLFPLVVDPAIDPGSSHMAPILVIPISCSPASCFLAARLTWRIESSWSNLLSCWRDSKYCQHLLQQDREYCDLLSRGERKAGGEILL